MSTFRAPSERRNTFNPVFYNSDASTGATLEDLDTKLSRINGVSSGQTLSNASFSGTVTGLTPGMISTLDSQLSALSAGNANSNFKANYSKSYLNSWDPATIGYLDFSDPAQLGQDATGKGNDAVIGGPVSYVANATRTNAVRFPVEYVGPGSGYPSENTPCIQLDNQLQILKTLSPSNWSISLWINVDPASTGLRPTILSATRRDDTGLPPTSLQLWTEPNGNIHWRGRLGGLGPNTYGMGKLPVGTWAHLAMVFTPSNVTTYINGVQTGVCSTAGLVINSLATKEFNALTLGSTDILDNVSSTFVGYLAFAGMMSDVSLHARALTQPEVARLTADDYGASIFVLAGSSNMVGVPQVVAGIDNVYPTRVIQYDTASNQAGGTAVLQASNPLRNMGTIVTGSTGLWRTFVSDMHQYGKLAWRRKILVVPCGYTGSSFASEWAADGLMSNVTISAVNGAMNRNPMNSVAAFLWSSGETDVANIRSTYAADMQAMFSLFQASIPGFSTTTTPIILAEVSQQTLGSFVVGAVGTKRMIQQIREDVASLTAGNANMKVVKTSDLLCTQSVSTDWNIDSIRTLGSRYFDAFSQIKGFSRNQPVTILGPASTISASTGLPVALLTNETLSDLDERAATLDVRTATLESEVGGLEAAVYNVTTGLNSKMSNSLAGNFPLGVRSSNISMEGGDRSILNESIGAGGPAAGLLGGIIQDGTLSFVNNGYYVREFDQVARRAFTWAYMTAADTFVESMSLTYNGLLTVPGAVTAPSINTTIDGVANSSVGTAVTLNKSEISIRSAVVQSSANLDYTGAGASFHSTLPGTIIMDTSAGARTICLDMPAVGVTDTLRINRQLTIKNTGANSVTIQTTTSGGIANFLTCTGALKTTMVVGPNAEMRLHSFRNASLQFQWQELSAPVDQVLTPILTLTITNTTLTNANLPRYIIAPISGGNKTLTFPSLVSTDSKYSGWEIQVKCAAGGSGHYLAVSGPIVNLVGTTVAGVDSSDSQTFTFVTNAGQYVQF